MHITVVGTGYQGLVTGTCLAENGHLVTCVDRKADRVALLKNGQLPIHEPGLEELVARNLEEERLSFTTDLAAAVNQSLIVFLCVGTPAQEDGTVDLEDVYEAVRQIGGALNDYGILVNKCTCPPGTSDELARILAASAKHPCDVVANPDFIKEGSAVDDFMRPDRVVIGCNEVRVREIMKELYNPFLRTGRPFLPMNPRSAEMTKYATNVMLAARISVMNQLADMAEAYGADISEVREGLAYDGRIGPTFLFPGLGFGGPGLPKDLSTCIRLAQEKEMETDLFEAILAVNHRRLKQFTDQILGHFGDSAANRTIAIWGAAFKPRTDDLRNAPALPIIDALLDAGATVQVYDPVAGPALKKRYSGGITVTNKYYEVLKGADALVIVTEWNEFRRPDYAQMGALMAEKVIFDGRNLYTPQVMRDHGFTYISIGRPPV